MNMNNYSVVNENVKGEDNSEDYYHNYDRVVKGKKYDIIINKTLTQEDVEKMVSIIRTKERSKKSIFKKEYSCTKEISKYFDRPCKVQEYGNRKWLIELYEEEDI